MKFEKLNSYIEEKKKIIDSWLLSHLPPPGREPKPIFEAVYYALFPGGKRIRPILAIASCELTDGNIGDVLPIACAIEMIHTYSLIHDDLPCMDDDDLRRGKPTLHKAYNEAIAVLTGDILLTMAFEYMSNIKLYKNPSLPRIVMVINEIARASGKEGMVVGQVADITWEGSSVTEEKINYIHTNKTAKLIEVSVKSGAIMSGASYREVEVLSEYGRLIGLAFQIVDDVLDVTSTSDKIGKKTKKDLSRGKLSYVALHGIENSLKKAKELVERAKEKLAIFEEEKCWMLKDLAEYIVAREK
ncbi:MAG: polyprenyl synthetase family protein [Thermosulfidibacteraceae bacterium]|jgi:geranylgeranyl diphosphate synthase type II